jgi:hypothetical protein
LYPVVENIVLIVITWDFLGSIKRERYEKIFFLKLLLGFIIKVVIYQEGRVGIHHQSSYLSRGKGWDSSSK